MAECGHVVDLTSLLIAQMLAELSACAPLKDLNDMLCGNRKHFFILITTNESFWKRLQLSVSGVQWQNEDIELT